MWWQQVKELHVMDVVENSDCKYKRMCTQVPCRLIQVSLLSLHVIESTVCHVTTTVMVATCRNSTSHMKVLSHMSCLIWKRQVCGSRCVASTLPKFAAFQRFLCHMLHRCEHAGDRAMNSASTFYGLPLHLQHLIFVSVGAPLTVCVAASEIAHDSKLIAQWLLAKRSRPLMSACRFELWDVSEHLLDTYQYHPKPSELRKVLPLVAVVSRASLMGSLLKWCSHGRNSTNGCCWRQGSFYDCTCGAVCQSLELAASQGDIQTCKLLSQRTEVDTQVVRYAACEAAKAGRIQALQFLITSCPQASSPRLYGSPVCCAAEGGQVEAIQLLMCQGADINHTAGSPWSSHCVDSPAEHPLQCAASNGHDATIK
jgi:hypothetical protein